MNIELLNLLEALRLLIRNPIKYARGVGGMYLLGIKGFELGLIARACFFFFRNQDDALDGDRKDIKNPLAHVLACRQQIASGKYTGHPKIAVLAKFAIEALQGISKQGDNPKQYFLDEIDVMLFDYHRAKARVVLTAKELKDYYRRTFFPVVNLMLIGLGSKLRAKDIPQLSFCQGRIYTIRDLNHDWRRGIINIPTEVLRTAGLTPASSVNQVINSKTVRDWFDAQLRLCLHDLPILEKKLTSINEALTVKMCMGLINPLYKLSRQFLDNQL